MFGTQKNRCREFRGPTPHAVAVRAKFPSLKPPDYLTLERQKLEAGREKYAEFSKYQQTWDNKNSWIQRSDRHFIQSNIQREVKAALNQLQLSIEERRQRLGRMLEAEEKQYMKEIEEKKERTALEKHAKMRDRAKALRDKRETERQQLVSAKLEQLFINQCEEIRTIQSKRREEEARTYWAAQVQTKQEQQRHQQEKERQYTEMCETIRQTDEQNDRERAQSLREKTTEHMNHLAEQIGYAENKRLQAKRLKEEEAQLLREQREMLRLQEQREQQQKVKAQQTRRRQLDQGYMMKIRRLAKKQQEELALDMSILEQVLSQETDDKQEAAQRKCELRDEQQRYRQYFEEELKKQKRLELETELLMEEELKVALAKREQQSQMEREARNRLMKDVMEARSLQIQHKLELNMQEQAQLARDREELIRTTAEIKLLDKEEKRRQKEKHQAYNSDLQAQIEHQQTLRRAEKVLEEREHHYGLAMQQDYESLKQRVLSGPASHTIISHPFRRIGGPRSAPVQRHYSLI